MFPISDSVPTRSFPFINYFFIVATCIVWFLQITALDFEVFMMQYSFIPADIDFANFTTLTPFITSIFLHGGWLHIISNMWFLRVFGDNVEDRLGHVLYFFLYLAAGIAGSLAQYILSPSSTIPMLGASGAVAGALGAYFAFFPHHKVKTLIPVFGFMQITNMSASFMLGYWIVLQIFSGVFSAFQPAEGGIAFFAHIGGFALGFLIGKLFGNRGVSPSSAYES